MFPEQKLKAMLPGRTLSAAKAGELLAAESWAIQRKFDGRRIIIGCNANSQEPFILNRNGARSNLYNHIKSTLPLDWMTAQDRTIIFDGEWFGTSYVIFDVIHLDDEVSIDNTFSQRWSALLEFWNTWSHLAGGDAYFTIPVTVFPFSVEHQLNFVGSSLDGGAEGVVFRSVNSQYLFGRSLDVRRLKFRKRVDAIVSHLYFHETGKHSAQLSLVKPDGTGIELCDVSTLHFGDIELGNIVEIEFSHLSATGTPVQPVIKSIRDDKDSVECTTDQLKAIPTISNAETFQKIGDAVQDFAQVNDNF